MLLSYCHAHHGKFTWKNDPPKAAKSFATIAYRWRRPPYWENGAKLVLSQLDHCGKDLLMTVYKAYFQSKFDYGIWGCTTQSNIDKIQRMQNRVARIITGCYDFINTRGQDLVVELNLQNITERRNYFLCNLMFKSIHGLAPTYLSDSIVMNADINEYNARGAKSRHVYQPRPRIEKYKNSFLYKAGELWNALPSSVKESPDLDTFKQRYKALNSRSS